jgi:capsule polysaccharide modification protein KpsS
VHIETEYVKSHFETKEYVYWKQFRNFVLNSDKMISSSITHCIWYNMNESDETVWGQTELLLQESVILRNNTRICNLTSKDFPVWISPVSSGMAASYIWSEVHYILVQFCFSFSRPYVISCNRDGVFACLRCVHANTFALQQLMPLMCNLWCIQWAEEYTPPLLWLSS